MTSLIRQLLFSVVSFSLVLLGAGCSSSSRTEDPQKLQQEAKKVQEDHAREMSGE